MSRPWLRTGARLALLVVLAGCSDEASQTLDRMAQEHRGDRGDAAGAAAGAEPGVPVWVGEVGYGELDGTPLRGYLARAPEGARGRPAVLVIHEWWGLNDNIRAMTRQLAASGYTALAVDLYEGSSTADPQQARRLASLAMSRGPRVQDNLGQAYAYLERSFDAPRVGVIGWCFGGGWSLQTALLLPREIDATVIYYGMLVTDRDRLATLEMPILGIFGGRDRAVPVARVQEFEQVLEDLGKQAKILMFEDADHGFANPSGNRFEPEAAEQAWAETLAFLEAHLRPGDS